jgi:hypothetical protein
MFVGCCLGSGLCNKLITHSEESYWVCMCVILCYLETSVMGGLGMNWAVASQNKKYKVLRYLWLCCNIRMSKMLYSVVVTAAVSKSWSEAGCSVLTLWHFPCFLD